MSDSLPVKVMVRFFVPGRGMLAETYDLREPAHITAWRGNVSATGAMQISAKPVEYLPDTPENRELLANARKAAVKAPPVRQVAA